mmetsp:Transcript_29297/g.41249  ORF Transcript_29297/g.41249 Transcript_29297/m.41249 type:complete len:167 (+) Transcript_29297:95-595(+)
MESALNNQPKEILEIIGSNLDVKALVSLRKSCKTLYHVFGNHSKCWKQALDNEAPSSASIRKWANHCFGCWKKLDINDSKSGSSATQKSDIIWSPLRFPYCSRNCYSWLDYFLEKPAPLQRSDWCRCCGNGHKSGIYTTARSWVEMADEERQELSRISRFVDRYCD